MALQQQPQPRKYKKRTPSKSDRQFREHISATIPTPAAPEVEEQVLLSIIYVEAFQRYIGQLNAECFESPGHRSVFLALKWLKNQMAIISNVSVAECLSSGKVPLPAEVKIGDILQFITNPFAPTAGDIYHYIHILHEYAAKRRILRAAQQAIIDINEGIFSDVFEIAERLKKNSNINPPTGALRTRRMPEVMASAAKLPPMKKLAGPLLLEGEIGILFSPPGVGKSLFAVQIADSLSKGEPVIPEVLANEAGKKKVLYVDLELRDQELYARYSHDGVEYSFSKDFIHMGENEDFYGLSSPDEMLAQIENACLEHEIEVLIIDNLTALTMDNLSDINVAQPILQKIKALQKHHKLTVLLVAHSNKIYNKTSKLQLSTMQGAAILQQLTQNIFTIGTSSKDEGLNYIKQLKGRSGLIFDEEHVIVVEKTRLGVSTFLGYKFLSYDTESNHLGYFEDEEILAEVHSRACDMLAQGFSWDHVKEAVDYPKSRATMQKNIRKFVHESPDWVLGADGKPRRAEWGAGKNMTPNPDAFDAGKAPF